MLRKTRFAILVLVILCLGLAVFAQDTPDFQALIDTEDVMSHVSVLSVDIGARPMGSEAEMSAAQYIAVALNDLGYTVETQEFETQVWNEEAEDYAGTVTSHNVIATKPGDAEMVVIGAHMDSVTDGTGAGDNATGIATMLAAAKVLAGIDTRHTVVFVAFGAEESGDPSGAQYYVKSLGDDIHNVIAMLNVDSVGMGTTVNVYAGATVEWSEDESEAPDFESGPVWVRDLALEQAADMGYSFGTTPAESWDGTTGDWSDHYAFVEKGVPIAYFEAWQWEGEGVDDPWWGIETAEGDVMHTAADVFDNVIPEKVEMTAEVLAATTAAIATGDFSTDSSG